jgi:phosphoglycolate phosphatase
MTTLFLYDIDGTLISTDGAGRASLNEAFEDLFGVADAFNGVRFGGRTDPGITGQAFANAGLEPTPERRARLQARYLQRLEESLLPGRVRSLPGIDGAIAATARRGTNALLTGNWLAGARVKLGALDLWERFAFGAFGDDSPDRNDLVPVAVERARARGLTVERVVVLGDTEADVACARAGGAIAVAVETGWSPRAQLEAAEPDLLIPDLERGLEALLALLDL